jgi:hypothetical protein
VKQFLNRNWQNDRNMVQYEKGDGTYVKYCKEDENFDLRLIVIYTDDVKSAEPTLETNCITLRMEQAFLSHIDGEAAFNIIRQKFHSGTVLEDDNLMTLVILPLTIAGSEGKQEMLEKVVDLAEQIADEEQRIFTLSGVIVASDKFISREYLDQIRRRINMTQLGQLYEKEKIEYANNKVRETSMKEPEWQNLCWMRISSLLKL